MKTFYLNGLGGTDNLSRLRKGTNILVQKSSRKGYFIDEAMFLGLSLNETGQAVLSYQISLDSRKLEKKINLNTFTGELGVYSWSRGAD